ncbi:transcription repressor OFP13-like [Chenopodium quinoa]|uniref:transcription repressor OFP13-like n=1 Tax=Chenopodium quinoa TaxID=63459 RepID=UPI000B79768F|nr:transcription repressor OFP13-like [Chenopodium quinoa]
MKLLPTTLFKPKDWRPICTQQPKTSSFRITTLKDDHIYKTINSVYFDNEVDTIETPDSWFTNSSEAGSLSTAECDDISMGETERETHLEAIVRGAQQSSSADHRLFFDPKESDSPRLQNTVMEEKTSPRTAEKGSYKKSVAMSLESEDPYVDFKKSMEEMVESLGVRDDWEGLEELLRWYLKINGREIHGYIINAFVDLLAEVKIIDDDVKNGDYHHEISKSTTTFSSAASSLSSLGSSTLLDPTIY